MDEPDGGAFSRPPELDDVVRICRALNEAGALYVLIGGFAVIAHGAGRTTKDIDFLVDPAPENIARVKTALAVLPDNAASQLADSDVAAYRVVRVADEVVVDLLGEACGVTYRDAVADAIQVVIAGTPVPVASPATLIRTKRTIRPSDAIDRQFLEAVLKSRASVTGKEPTGS